MVAPPPANARNFRAQLQAHGGIEVGQRFVKQKDFWLPHQGAAQGHPLAFAPGKFARLALQHRREI